MNFRSSGHKLCFIRVKTKKMTGMVREEIGMTAEKTSISPVSVFSLSNTSLIRTVFHLLILFFDQNYGLGFFLCVCICDVMYERERVALPPFLIYIIQGFLYSTLATQNVL